MKRKEQRRPITLERLEEYATVPEPEPISVEEFLEAVRDLAVNVELPRDATNIESAFQIMFRYKGKGKYHQVLGVLEVSLRQLR